MTNKFISESEKETFEFGRKLAASLGGGEAIALTGDLGAGKTVLTKGLAEGLGVRKNIVSPTFVLMKVYPARPAERKRRQPPIRQLCHVDAYRLASGADLEAIGLNDWLGRPDTVTVIEWAEKAGEILPEKRLEIRLKMGKKEGQRIISLKNIEKK